MLALEARVRKHNDMAVAFMALVSRIHLEEVFSILIIDAT